MTREQEELEMRDEDKFEQVVSKRTGKEGSTNSKRPWEKETWIEQAKSWVTTTAEVLMKQNETTSSNATTKGTIPVFVKRTTGAPTEPRVVGEVHAWTTGILEAQDKMKEAQSRKQHPEHRRAQVRITMRTHIYGKTWCKQERA